MEWVWNLKSQVGRGGAGTDDCVFFLLFVGFFFAAWFEAQD